MTQIGKLSDMFYEIKRDGITFEVVEKTHHLPDLHISKFIDIRRPDFWKFLLEVIVEVKEDKFEVIRNDDGDYNSQDIETAKQKLEYLRNIEKALEFMLPKQNK